jgi:hypothetical protein
LAYCVMPNHFHLLHWQKRAAGGKRGRGSYSARFDGFRGRPRAWSGIKRVASPFPPESYTDSQSNYEAGTATDSDPEGGPSFGGTITQTSVTTSEVLSVELASEDTSLSDSVSDSMSDVGTDILGTSASISGEWDTYRMAMSRNIISSISDSGTSSAPANISAGGVDDFSLVDTGSSTLTTNGHVYATDTYTYGESSSDNDSDSESLSNHVYVGAANDQYTNNNSGTITVSDTTTTSLRTRWWTAITPASSACNRIASPIFREARRPVYRGARIRTTRRAPTR